MQLQQQKTQLSPTGRAQHHTTVVVKHALTHSLTAALDQRGS